MHVHFENDNFNIFDLPLPQPRPQSPRSIDQRKIARVIIRHQIRLAVEKRFHFLVPGTIFYVYFPILWRALSKALWKSSVVEEESAIFPKDSRS